MFYFLMMKPSFKRASTDPQSLACTKLVFSTIINMYLFYAIRLIFENLQRNAIYKGEMILFENNSLAWLTKLITLLFKEQYTIPCPMSP